MQQGATRIVKASFSKAGNASFAREDQRQVAIDDDQFVANFTRGDLGLTMSGARVDIETLGETIKLEKSSWSLEEFTVSLVLGVDNGAINSPFSVVVDSFRDHDGGGSLKTSTCKTYGNETLPPTEAPTMAPTPASLAPTPEPTACTPGTPGCCPQQQSCVAATITCGADEVLNALRTVCGCPADFVCQPRVKGNTGDAAVLSLAPVVALIAAALQLMMH
jgi:hypothetical protein